MQPQMPIGSSLKNKGDTYEQKKSNSGYLYDGLFNYHRICLSLHLEIPKRNKKSETENTQHDNNENTETEQAENNESISFQDFEALEYFFSKEQVKLFQEELTSYLKNVKQMSLTSIRFLADDTTYPNASDINFCSSFRISPFFLCTTLPLLEDSFSVRNVPLILEKKSSMNVRQMTNFLPSQQRKLNSCKKEVMTIPP